MENVASRFGQRLAHTEKKYRDQALKKLALYLHSKRTWSDLELDKLWKALFYCMWMSDKRPIQEELSTNLSLLVHKLPTQPLRLRFVASFLRTMQREWHGIDGLRLDKFYSLVRKFVHQSFVLLQQHQFAPTLVRQFTQMLWQTILLQLPNGLRLHIADLYVTELCQATGKTIDNEPFVALLVPFVRLLQREQDKAVFKRVRELVFGPLLKEYHFGALPEKNSSKSASGEDQADETETEEDELPAFEKVDLQHLQHRIFQIASADDTLERNRRALYDLYGEFYQLTKVDSLKSVKDLAPPDDLDKADDQQAQEQAQEEEEAQAAAMNEPEGEHDAELSTKSKKKRKKNKRKTVEEDTEEKTRVEDKAPLETATPATKKQKREQPDSPKQEKTIKPVKSTPPKELEPKKTNSAAKEEPEKPQQDATSVKKQAKTDAKSKAAAAPKAKADKADKPAKADKKTPVEQPKADKKTATDQPKRFFIVKSGVKFQRCAVCKGFGKNFLPKAKDICAHCDRTAKATRKASVAQQKRRKLEATKRREQDDDDESDSKVKKVTFGKSKALPYSLSIKRLKASSKKALASPRDASEMKGVLKTPPSTPTETVKTKAKTKTTSTTKKVTSKSKVKAKATTAKRMKAADFF